MAKRSNPVNVLLSDDEIAALDAVREKVIVTTSRGKEQPISRLSLLRDLINAGIDQLNAGTFEFDDDRDESQPIVKVSRRRTRRASAA